MANNEGKSLTDIAWDELYAEVCACGARKRRKQSFCRDCYFALPDKVRNSLWVPMSQGYAEVYDEAKTYLQAETNRFKRLF